VSCLAQARCSTCTEPHRISPSTMQSPITTLVCMWTALLLVRGDAQTNPTSKVVELITQLQATMVKKGEASQAIYNEFSTWCSNRARELGHEVKAGTAEKEDLGAQIKHDTSIIKSKAIRVEDEGEDITKSETQIKEQYSIRQKEASNFKEEEAELIDVISMLKRAKAVIEKELAGGASMLQVNGAESISQLVDTMVKASLSNVEDAKKLMTLIQSRGEDESAAPPAVAAYSGSSSSVVSVLSNILDKAEKTLDQLRMKEGQAIANWNLLKQSLNQEIDISHEDKDDAAKAKAGAQEEKSVDEGDLGVTVKDVKADVATLADLRRVCIAKVEEFTTMTKSRDAELEALAKAKKVILEQASGAGQAVYGGSSFIQAISAQHSSSLAAAHLKASNKALARVQDLAKQLGSVELSQLASRIQATLRAGAEDGEDPFAKVVGMISDMITKLEQEAADSRDHEDYCVKELADSKAKKEDRTDSVEAITTKIDQMSARSKKLKTQVANIQKELADIASSQSEMNKIREEEHSEYLDEKAELEKGINGVNLAIKALQDFYGKTDNDHQVKVSASASIVSLLETIESDFSQSLAELMAGEQTSTSDYKAQTQDNKVAKESKEIKVDLKTKEYTSLDKALSEAENDRTGVQNELTAVLEYLAKVTRDCTVKPENFHERQERRAKEIAGLKEALTIIETETSLMQVTSHRFLRGNRQHALQ